MSLHILKQMERQNKIKIHHWWTKDNALQFLPEYLVSTGEELINLQGIFFDALDELIAELKGQNKYSKIDPKKEGGFVAALKKAKGKAA